MRSQPSVETLIDGVEAREELVGELLDAVHGPLEARLKAVRRPEAAVGVERSPLGPLLIALGPKGLAMVHFLAVSSGPAAAIARLREDFDPVEDQTVIRKIGDEVRGFLGGDLEALRTGVDFTLIHNDFQRAALKRLCRVPLGAVITYQGLSAAIGAPNGQRAIGNAMNSNPIPVYVPCHRVVRSDGTIGGYGGGIAAKLKLLEVEGFALPDKRRLPASAVWGHRGTHIYCRLGCKAAARADHGRLVIFADSRHAEEAGLRACKLCRPS